MNDRGGLEVRAPSPLAPTGGRGEPGDARDRADADPGPTAEPRYPCIWISATCPVSLEPVGRAVQQLLSARLVQSELVCDAAEAGAGSSTATDGERIEYLANCAFARARRARTVVVTGPLLDSAAARAVRERIGRLVRVSLQPAVVDGGPPPIPTIYRFFQGPHILEAAIPPRAVESADRADVVVGGALRPPDQLAGEIVDALSRTGWLTVPLPSVLPAARRAPETAPLGHPVPGPLLAVRASR